MSDDKVDGFNVDELSQWGPIGLGIQQLFHNYTHDSGYLYVYLTGKNTLTVEKMFAQTSGKPYSDEEMRKYLDGQKKVYGTMKNDLYVMRLDTSKPLAPQLILSFPSLQTFKSFGEFRQHLIAEETLQRELSGEKKSNLPQALQDNPEEARAPRLYPRKRTQKDFDHWQNRLDQSGISLVHPGKGETIYHATNPHLPQPQIATVDGALHGKFYRACNIPDHLLQVQLNFKEAKNKGHRGFVQYYKPHTTDFMPYRSFSTIEEAYLHVTKERRDSGLSVLMMLDAGRDFGEQLREGPYISPRQAIHQPLIAPIYGHVDVSQKPLPRNDEWMNRPEPGSWR